MQRAIASQYCRTVLDAYGLREWGIRLSTNERDKFLGLCSYKDKVIILNAFHIDTHPEIEVYDTIKHEVAHALTPGHGHDDVWKDKAKELGAQPYECSAIGLSATAIDAIRSGADLEVTYEERVIREPKYTIKKLQDKCPTCGKVAVIKTKKDVSTSAGRKCVITYQCLHVEIRDADSKSPFEEITFDGDINCKHKWGIGKYRTVCQKCNAKRLYEYQIEGARSVEINNGRFGIFDEMGLGKTIQALAYLKFHPEAYPFLWVTKSGIKYQHAKEIVRILGKKHVPLVISSSKHHALPGFSGYVVSYDLFRRIPQDFFGDIKCVVLDECQAISNPDSARTNAVRAYVKKSPKFIPLSGTPWKNRGTEFFPVLNMLEPKRYHSFAEFKRFYVSTYWDGKYEKSGGIENPEKFREQNSDLFIRRERKDVLPELPLIDRRRLYCEVPEHARNVINEEEDKLVELLDRAELEGNENSFAIQAQKNQLMMVMKQVVGIAKVPMTVELAQEFLEDTDRKLAIFVHHKACGEMVAEQMRIWCKENNQPAPLVLTADLDSGARFDVAQKFNSPSYRLLIASTLASGEGLNLQTCSDCIMHERQWNPANEEQAEGRFIRIGQEAQSVTATYILADDSVDTDLEDIVETKRRNFVNSMNTSKYDGAIAWNEEELKSKVADNIRARRNRRKR